MSRLCRFFVILIAAYTAAGCFAPIGSIGGSDADLLLAMPKRLKYKEGERFIPKNDLDVHALYQGVEEPVPIDLVKVSITEPPYNPNKLEDVPFDKGYLLEKLGSHVVVLEYEGLSTSYSFEVGTVSDGASPGINIEWVE